MTNLIVQDPSTTLPAEQVALSDGAKSYAKMSVRPNTLRAYYAQLAAWRAWAEQHGHVVEPAQPGAVANWLSERANGTPGASRSSLAVALAAIVWWHRGKGLPFEVKSSNLELVRKGLMRAAKTARLVRQAKPLTADLVRSVLEDNAGSEHEYRDAAVIALLYSFGLRRSEVVALDFQRLGDRAAEERDRAERATKRPNRAKVVDDDPLVGVLELEGNVARVTMLKSKASQEVAEAIEIERDFNPRAFAAVERWLALGKIEPGTPVMRGVDPAGTVSKRRLSDDRITRAVKSAVERHYLKQGTAAEKAREAASAFSGHSGRVGLVVSAAEAGASDTAIMSVTRHKSPTMVARYAKQARDKKRSPHLLKGVGV